MWGIAAFAGGDVQSLGSLLHVVGCTSGGPEHQELSLAFIIEESGVYDK